MLGFEVPDSNDAPDAAIQFTKSACKVTFVREANEGWVGDQLFCRDLPVAIPELKPILEEHIKDNDELLPYVFLGAYVWPWFESLFNSGTERGLQLCRQYMSALEVELARHHEETSNLIGVAFLEWLTKGQGRDSIRALLPSLLGEELERMENWDRKTP